MSNDKNGAKYGNMGIKWTVLIRLIDIRTQKSVLTYNTWQKIWKYYECHFSYVFWWKKRVFQRRVFLIIEEAKKMFFLLYICIGMGAATVPMQIPTFGIFEHPYCRALKFQYNTIYGTVISPTSRQTYSKEKQGFDTNLVMLMKLYNKFKTL